MAMDLRGHIVRTAMRNDASAGELRAIITRLYGEEFASAVRDDGSVNSLRLFGADFGDIAGQAAMPSRAETAQILSSPALVLNLQRYLNTRFDAVGWQIAEDGNPARNLSQLAIAAAVYDRYFDGPVPFSREAMDIAQDLGRNLDEWDPYVTGVFINNPLEGLQRSLNPGSIVSSDNPMQGVAQMAAFYAEREDYPVDRREHENLWHILECVEQIESGGEMVMNGGGSSAYGNLQIMPRTWRILVERYGEQDGVELADYIQPWAQRRMCYRLLEENQTLLRSTLGREPSATELYFAHFFSPEDVRTFLRMDINGHPADALPAAAGANPDVFYHRQANGEPDLNRPRTRDEIMQIYENRVIAARCVTCHETGYGQFIIGSFADTERAMHANLDEVYDLDRLINTTDINEQDDYGYARSYNRAAVGDVIIFDQTRINEGFGIVTEVNGNQVTYVTGRWVNGGPTAVVERTVNLNNLPSDCLGFISTTEVARRQGIDLTPTRNRRRPEQEQEQVEAPALPANADQRLGQALAKLGFASAAEYMEAHGFWDRSKTTEEMLVDVAHRIMNEYEDLSVLPRGHDHAYALQYALSGLGYSTNGIDGIIGGGTNAAITRFKADHPQNNGWIRGGLDIESPDAPAVSGSGSGGRTTGI